MNIKTLGVLASTIGFYQTLTLFPANAAWEYTRWGMSVKEVQTASQGKALPASSSSNIKSTSQTLLTSLWQYGNYAFDVYYNFSGAEPKLTEIVLKAKGDNKGLGQALIYKYGRPVKAQANLASTGKKTRGSSVQKDFVFPTGENRISRTQRTNSSTLLEWVNSEDYIKYESTTPTEAVLVFKPVQPEQAALGLSTTLIANQFLDEVISKDFVKARDKLNPMLKEQWTPEVMQAKIASLEERVGPFKKRISTRAVDNIVLLTTEFETITDDLIFIFDEDKKIVGIDFPQQETDLLP
jgi:hypothetical protein